MRFDASGKLIISDDSKSSKKSAISTFSGSLTLNDDDNLVQTADKGHDDDDDSDSDGDSQQRQNTKRGRAAFTTSKITQPKRQRPTNLDSGSKFKNKGGGDKKVGSVEPYAYLRFDPASLNKRKKSQYSNQFQQIMQPKPTKGNKKFK